MIETQLFESPLVTITEFTCPPGDAAWASSNLIKSCWPLVVFPRTAVAIRYAGGPQVLSTPNVAMLYNPDQEYDRELRDERGDLCVYFTIHEQVIEALEHDSAVVGDGRLTATHVPSTKSAYLQQHLLARHLRSGEADALLVEETAVRVIGQVLARPPAPPSGRGTTVRAHLELTEAAKERIVESISEALGLAELAAGLGTSPFHLARIFRAQTGFALHQYRKHLRLRLALDRIGQGEPLSRIAYDLGFASHSHFTDSFRREFGIAPSAVRGRPALSLLAT
jgi:AraC family transcriptional regulator